MKWIVPAKGHCLNSKIGQVRDRYNHKLEALFAEHQIYNKLKRIEQQATFLASDDVQQAIEKIDQLMTQLTRRTKKGFRKLYKGDYNFSPEMKEYLDTCHAYRGLLQIASRHQWKWVNIV